MDGTVEKLLVSDEPAVRFKVLVHVLRKDPACEEVGRAQDAVKASPRVQMLLAEREADGRILRGPYGKWRGAHWVLATLADIGYPAGDESLLPLLRQVSDWLLSKRHKKSIQSIEGRVRRCASQEGNALYATLTLGLADVDEGSRQFADEMAGRLVRWSWPDGGWNCDKKPEAVNSSFMESLIPLRALALYARRMRSAEAETAASGASEIFLKRHLFKTQSDGGVMRPEFVKLHYPCYWHYDILFGLKVMAGAGFIDDPRCQDALDLLEEKRLPDGGFPAEGKYYRVTEARISNSSPVDWGGVNRRRMNEFVTADALHVLRAADRLSV